MSAWLVVLLLGATRPITPEAWGETYRAVVGADGNLAAVYVGGTQLLDPFTDDSRGGALWDQVPLRLPFSRRDQRNATHRSDRAGLTYQFNRDRIGIQILNAGRASLEYRLRLAADWRIDQHAASTEWGARAAIATAAPVAVGPQEWRVTCAALGSTRLDLQLDNRELAPRPPADGIGITPRALRPWSFVLRDRPPDIDADGTMMTIPLLLSSDLGEETPVAVNAGLVGGPEESREVTLPGHDVAPYDVRLPRVEPGVYELLVEVTAGEEQVRRRLTLAFGPERWPRPAAAVPTSPTGIAPERSSEPPTGLPAGWRRFALRGGGGQAVLSLAPGESAPQVALLGWPDEPAEWWARLGLSTLLADRDYAAAFGAAVAAPAVAAHRPPARASFASAEVLSLWQPEAGLRPPDRARVLLGRAVTPGEAAGLLAESGAAVEEQLYTVDAAAAEAHFAAAQRAWLVESQVP